MSNTEPVGGSTLVTPTHIGKMLSRALTGAGYEPGQPNVDPDTLDTDTEGKTILSGEAEVPFVDPDRTDMFVRYTEPKRISFTVAFGTHKDEHIVFDPLEVHFQEVADD